MRARHRPFASCILALSLLLVAIACGGNPLSQYEEHAVFVRPDGAYRVVVLRERANTALPGQASDAPGIAVLYDRAGNELYRADVEMVQLVEEVDWPPGRVYIKLIADWELPTE
jgi:hypothetical protein